MKNKFKFIVLFILVISAIFMPISIMAAELPTNQKDGDTYTNDRGIPFEYRGIEESNGSITEGWFALTLDGDRSTGCEMNFYGEAAWIGASPHDSLNNFNYSITPEINPDSTGILSVEHFVLGQNMQFRPLFTTDVDITDATVTFKVESGNWKIDTAANPVLYTHSTKNSEGKTLLNRYHPDLTHESLATGAGYEIINVTEEQIVIKIPYMRKNTAYYFQFGAQPIPQEDVISFKEFIASVNVVADYTCVTAEKSWVESNGFIPEIKMQLHRNGEAFGAPISPNGEAKEATQLYIWNTLDYADENGNPYDYTVTEIGDKALYEPVGTPVVSVSPTNPNHKIYKFTNRSIDLTPIIWPNDGSGGGGTPAVHGHPDYTFRSIDLTPIIWPNNGSGGGGTPAEKLHKRYVHGYPDYTFRPEGSITRAEAAMIFARLMQDKMDVESKGIANFNDLEDNAWYLKAVSYAVEEGLMKGYPDGSFKPNNPITRAELVAIAARFGNFDVPGNPGLNLSDVDKAHWAYESIVQAEENELVKGYLDGSFKPDSSITRAESVTLLNRLLKRYPDKAFIDRNPHLLAQYSDDDRHWAFYDIHEASNTHSYNVVDSKNEKWLSIFDK